MLGLTAQQHATATTKDTCRLCVKVTNVDNNVDNNVWVILCSSCSTSLTFATGNYFYCRLCEDLLEPAFMCINTMVR